MTLVTSYQIVIKLLFLIILFLFFSKFILLTERNPYIYIKFENEIILAKKFVINNIYKIRFFLKS